MGDKIRAYWFSNGDRLRYGDDRVPAVGVTHVHDGQVILCEKGLHASEHPMDALEYAPGPTLWVVELGGRIVRDPVNHADKIAASERTYLLRIEMEPLLRSFARWCALHTPVGNGKTIADLWDMPAVVRQYLETGDESLRDAARAAARAAAWDAARDAAWDAARDAARAAAWDAAWDAARDAAWDAARDAAWDAARDAQRARFKVMVEEAIAAAARSDSSPSTGLTIEAVRGDITTLQVDVIVNAANADLAGGGGVDGAIHHAAGFDQLRAACAALGGCPTGSAKLTPGFALPAKHIAHAVGPVWRGGAAGEADLLAGCYRAALACCDEVQAGSVAFPAISTGVYGYPPDQAAEIAIRTLRETPTKVQRAVLVAFDDATLAIYQRLLG